MNLDPLKCKLGVVTEVTDQWYKLLLLSGDDGGNKEQQIMKLVTKPIGNSTLKEGEEVLYCASEKEIVLPLSLWESFSDGICGHIVNINSELAQIGFVDNKAESSKIMYKIVVLLQNVVGIVSTNPKESIGLEVKCIHVEGEDLSPFCIRPKKSTYKQLYIPVESAVFDYVPSFFPSLEMDNR